MLFVEELDDWTGRGSESRPVTHTSKNGVENRANDSQEEDKAEDAVTQLGSADSTSSAAPSPTMAT